VGAKTILNKPSTNVPPPIWILFLKYLKLSLKTKSHIQLQ